MKTNLSVTLFPIDEGTQRFLKKLRSLGTVGAGKFDLPRATREQDRIRRICSRRGLAVCEKGVNGRRWYITELGLATLKHAQDSAEQPTEKPK